MNTVRLDYDTNKIQRRGSLNPFLVSQLQLGTGNSCFLKYCFKCKKNKLITEFSKDKSKKDCLRSCCKTCNSIYMKKYSKIEIKKKSAHFRVKKYRKTEKYRQTLKQYRRENKIKNQARDFVNHAIAAGRLARVSTLQCLCCNKQAKNYHHHKGYERENWLEVMPACDSCHGELDQAIPKTDCSPFLIGV